MKLLVRILVPLVVLGGCIWGDIILGGFLFSKLPQDIAWLFWAKLGIVVGLFWLTAGIIIIVVYLAGALAYILTD